MRRKHCASISRPLECGPAAPYIIAMTTTPTLTDAAATRVAGLKFIAANSSEQREAERAMRLRNIRGE